MHSVIIKKRCTLCSKEIFFAKKKIDPESSKFRILRSLALMPQNLTLKIKLQKLTGRNCGDKSFTPPLHLCQRMTFILKAAAGKSQGRFATTSTLIS